MGKMKLLLIEDDSIVCEKFKKIEQSRNDIEFIGITDSSIKAITIVKQKMVFL